MTTYIGIALISSLIFFMILMGKKERLKRTGIAKDMAKVEQLEALESQLSPIQTFLGYLAASLVMAVAWPLTLPWSAFNYALLVYRTRK